MGVRSGVLRRHLLVAASLTALVAPSFVAAQELPKPAPEERRERDESEIIVTGTNIRTGFSAPVPVQIVGQKTIETFGAVQFSDVLKAIPGNSGTEAYTEAQTRAGNAQFNLRGLGYTSTLTLVNGRRAGVSPLTDDTGGEYVDINQFPLAMISRIEVLKDGASAIYGSDAVAGVVNIITRKGYEGLELSGGVQDSVNRNWNVNFATGKRFDGGSFNVYGTYLRQTGTVRSDFDWLVDRVGGHGIAGRSQLLNATGAPSTYRPGAFNAAGQPIGRAGGVGFADPNCEAAGGVFRINDNGTVDRSQCLVDFADQVGIIPAARRIQVFAEGEYNLSDRIRLFGEASFSRNSLISVKGPGSYNNGSTVSNSAGNVFIPGSHPFNFFKADPTNPNRLIYVDPASWNPAVDKAVDLVTSSRIFGEPYMGKKGGGQRRTVTNYFRAVGGFEVELPHDWQARLSYQFASADTKDLQDYRYNADLLNAAILSGKLNPFGLAISNPNLVSPKDGVSVSGNSQAVIDSVLSTSVDTYESTQHVVDAMVSGKLFDLPAGPVGVAIGGQYRRLNLKYIPDALQAAGEGDNSTLLFPLNGTSSVYAAYAELSVPITSFADAQLAARYEDYGKPVGSTFNPKFAAKVTAADWLSFRGSVSSSFQAPTITQTSETLGRQFVNDPASLVNGQLVCRNVNQSSNALIRTRGDDNLKPQKSFAWSLGIIAKPVHGASFSVDYWRYRYKDLIASGQTPQAIVDRDCLDDGIPNDPRIGRSGSGLIDEITTSYENIGRVVTDGFDIAASYQFAPGDLGQFGASVDATYVNKFDVFGAGGPAFDGAGSRNFFNNFRTMPRWRGTAQLGWERERVGASVTVRYIGGYKNDQGNNARVSPFTTVDVSLAYAFPILGRDRPTVFTIGADNLFDRDPPALVKNDANGNRLTDATITYVDRPGYDAFGGADLRGRVLYLRLKQEF
jgi:iron complex outermembrane recepter protein